MGCDKKQKRVLIVDDSESDTELFKGLFASKNPDAVISVAQTKDEVQKFIAVEEGHSSMPCIDLVIVDFNMPKDDGIAVLKNLKSDPDLSSIPVVVFSGSDSKKDIQEAYRLGANSYLVKPVQFDELSKVVSLIDTFWLKSACLPSRE